MAWDDICGQDLAKRIWQAHLASGAICNAYLLAGPEGIGKRLLAREMAKALNCPANDPSTQPSAALRIVVSKRSASNHDGRPCDTCSTCSQITRQIHPDVHWLNPEGASGLIKIETVRGVLGRIALRPFSGRYQLVMIDGAERLTEEAANSLLKSLEEPPSQTRFLLMTSQLSRCLPTIVSRCQLIRCQRLAPEVVESILVSRKACDTATASVIARLAGGSAARALGLAGRWPAYERLLDQFGADQSSTWLETPLPETRDEVQRLLDGMMAWLRDVAVASEGDPAWVAHRMAEDPLRRAAERVDLDRCLETALSLVSLRDSLDQFVSPRLVAALAREQWLSLLESGSRIA